MNFKLLRQLFSLSDLRNALLAFFVVFGGLALTLFTVWAQTAGRPKLAGAGAVASLIFVLLILIFVVPPLARNASAEASQMNLPFEFTLGGAIFLGLISIVGFSAWNTGNNLLFLFLSFLASAMIVGFTVGNFCLKKLDVKMRFPETIFAEQATPILVSLHNRKRFFPSYSIVAEVRGKEREKSLLAGELKKILPAKIAERLARSPIVKLTLDYFIHIPRNKTVENKAEHVFSYRGRFIIKDFELSTKFPFGFFRHRRRLPAQAAEIIVFPKLASIEDETENLPLEIGKLVTQKRGLGQDLLSLRDYQPLDDLRRIDWKATARANRLIVREFSAEDDRKITIFLDTRMPEENDGAEIILTLRERIEAEKKGKSAPVSARFEKGVSLAASLLSHFTEEQAEIRLVIDGAKGDFGIGKEQLYNALKRLALAEPRFEKNWDFSTETLEEIFTEKENSYTFFITASGESDLPDELIQKTKVVKF
ncbi:MAG: hypothetical protein JWN60_933 [Acidobacteria bacterium]|nr:hypothetical protein [Acidobacteriota bacterium]